MAQYRQWVLTFPWELRLTLAMNRGLLSEMLRVFMLSLFAWQRKRGRALGIRGETGAVTFIQRFGGALNTNPHFHSIVPDGLFSEGEDGSLAFVALPAPTEEDLQGFTGRLVSRLTKIAEAYCLDREVIRPDNDDEVSTLRAAAYEAQKVPLTGEHANGKAMQGKKPLCGRQDGFTLHAARVVRANDREGLERLARYGLRAPFALERFSVDPDGNVRYRLPRPWPTPTGRTELEFEPQALLRRLSALMPGPYLNLTRYAGVFANRSRFREKLPPPRPPKRSASEQQPQAPATTEPAVDLRPRRLGWAQLLRRVLDIDVLTCAKCASAMTVVAFLTDQKVVTRILDHLVLPSAAPLVAESRLVVEQYCDAQTYDDAVPVEETQDSQDSSPDARGPP